MNSFSVPNPSEQNSFSNKSSATSDSTEKQLRHWSVAVAIAQLLCFGSLWFAPQSVAWFVIGLQLLHIFCFFFYKEERSWADAITIARGTITAYAAFLALRSDTINAEVWLLFLLALLLDGADGFVARKTGSSSPEGAIFDMESDGIWVTLLALTLVGLGIEPVWILILGLWRPVYALVSAVMPKVVETHPKGSWFGKTVFVTVAVELLVASSPWRVFFLTQVLLGVACVLLSFSFVKSIVLHVREIRAPQHR